MFGFREQIDEQGELGYTWEILGYELKEPRFGFVALSINTENIMEKRHMGKIVPRDRMIHKNSLQYDYFCGPEVESKAIYCPSDHFIVITRSKVVDYKMAFGEITKSHLDYSDWPTDIVASGNQAFDAPLDSNKALGFVVKGLFTVIGGSQKVFF